MKLSILAATLCFANTLANAQLANMDAYNKAACDASLARPFTAPPLDPSLQPDCDSAASYFGIGRPIDYAAARRCAYVERSRNNDIDSNIFAGAGVLSMLYANGQGVKPDLDLATRFTCESSWAAPAEVEGRLEIIAKDRETGTFAKFDLCDTATSGLSEGWCASIDSRLQQVSRRQKTDRLAAKLPPSALPAFHTLQTAEDTFDHLRASHEVDLSGTGRAAFELEEENKLRDQFLINLQRLTAPTFTSPVPFKTADSNLNTAYQALKSSLPSKEGTDSGNYGTLGFDGVQQTQRAWLALRDAWVAFATTIHSAATADQVAAVITEQRAHQLKSLLRS